MSYAQAWADLYEGRISRGLKAQTLKDYRAAVDRKEFVEHFSGLRLSEVEADDLKRYAAALKRAGLSPRTIRNLVLPLRLVLAEATDAGHIRSNPAAGLRVVAAMGVGERQEDARAFKDDELERFLSALTSAPAPYRMLFEFLLQTGLRIGEALALTWEDVSLDFARVHVTKRIYKGTTDAPKSKHGNRRVPLTAQMVEQLREHRDAARGVVDAQPVFTDSAGHALDYYAVRRAFKKVAGAADVPWAGPHTCRHTCASWLFRSPERGGVGANPKQAQVWLGHHSPAFTMATYVHLMDEDLPTPAGLEELVARGATDGATRASKTTRNHPGATQRESA